MSRDYVRLVQSLQSRLATRLQVCDVEHAAVFVAQHRRGVAEALGQPRSLLLAATRSLELLSRRYLGQQQLFFCCCCCFGSRRRLGCALGRVDVERLLECLLEGPLLRLLLLLALFRVHLDVRVRSVVSSPRVRLVRLLRLVRLVRVFGGLGFS